MYTNDNVLLITKDHLFKYTQLQGNVDIDKVTPFVKIAQDIQVQEILGTKLYRKILTDVQADTLAGNYLDIGIAVYPANVDSLRNERFYAFSRVRNFQRWYFAQHPRGYKFTRQRTNWIVIGKTPKGYCRNLPSERPWII
jgi:hypothetical protein